MSGRKPDLSITITPTTDKAKRHPLAAFWKEDGGRMSGGLERTIKRVLVEYEDGTVVKLTKEAANGKTRWSHYVNAKDWSGPPSTRETMARAAASNANDWSDDSDVPF